MKTPSGSLRGSSRTCSQALDNCYLQFKGIPYASPPVGHLRFRVSTSVYIYIYLLVHNCVFLKKLSIFLLPNILDLHGCTLVNIMQAEKTGNYGMVYEECAWDNRSLQSSCLHFVVLSVPIELMNEIF